MKKIGLITFTGDLFSFGIRSIEAYLRKLGHEVLTINCTSKEDNYINLLTEFQLRMLAEKCKDVDVIGISLISIHSTNRLKQVYDYLKGNCNSTIVIGGVPVTLNPRMFLEFAEFVCVGEGETFFPHFLNSKNNSEVPGLGYKSSDGNVYINAKLPYIDINQIPIHRFDFKNTYILNEQGIHSLYEKPEILYKFTNSKGYRIFQSRGCTLACTYCCNRQLKNIFKGHGKHLRHYRIERIIEEIEYAKNIIPNLKRVKFMEDDFASWQSADLKMLIKEYQKRISLPFSFYATPYTLTTEKLNILIDNKAQIEWIKVGLQSASEKVSKQIYKRAFNKSKIINIIEQITSHNIFLRLDMILQNPYESYSDRAESIDFFYDLGQKLKKTSQSYKLIEIGLFSLTFYPGTELYNKAMKDGIINNDYIDDVLLSKNKYNRFGAKVSSPYALTMLSTDLILVTFYNLLMANRLTFIRHIIKRRFILKFIDLLTKNEMFRYIFIISKPILVSIRSKITGMDKNKRPTTFYKTHFRDQAPCSSFS